MLPLLLFVLVTFIVPIGQMLHRSVYNPGFAGNMPQVSAWFAANPQGADPDEAAFAALAADLTAAAEARTIGIVGTRMNYDVPGTRSLFTATGRKVRDGLEPPFRKALLDIDALARAEGRDWVFKGADCLAPDDTRCLINLSDGGKDAVTGIRPDPVPQRPHPAGPGRPGPAALPRPGFPAPSHHAAARALAR